MLDELINIALAFKRMRATGQHNAQNRDDPEEYIALIASRIERIKVPCAQVPRYSVSHLNSPDLTEY